MQLTRIKPGDFPQLKEDWNRLADADPEATVFQRFEWNESWWRIFAGRQELYVLAAHDQDRLVGIAPFLRRTLKIAGLELKEIGFLAAVVSDYCRLLAAPGYAASFQQAVWDYFRAHNGEWDVIRLTEVPESAWPGLIDSVTVLPLPHTRMEATKTFYIPIARRSWDDYWDSISKRLRTKHERQKRLLPGCQLRIYRGDQITPELLADIVELNRLGPSAKRDGSIFLNEPYRQFHCERLFQSTLRPHIVIAALYLGPKLASYHYCFYYQNMLGIYNCNYDKIFSRISLGLLVHFLNIRMAFESGYDGFDFMRGDYQYKKDFNTQLRQNRELLLFRNRPVQMLHFAFRHSYRLAMKIYCLSILPVKQRVRAGARKAAYYLEVLRLHGCLHYVRVAARAAAKRLFLRGSSYFMRASRKDLSLLTCLKPVPSGFAFREITLNDYPLFEGVATRKHMPDIINRFWTGDRCWGAVQGDNLVGFGWMTDKNTYEKTFETQVRVRSGELYVYDCMIAPAYRGQGLMYLLLWSLFKDEHLKRYQQVTGIVNTRNTPMLKTMQDLEFVIEEKINHWKILFLNRQTRSKLHQTQ